jgi:hypothetical protein
METVMPCPSTVSITMTVTILMLRVIHTLQSLTKQRACGWQQLQRSTLPRTRVYSWYHLVTHSPLTLATLTS